MTKFSIQDQNTKLYVGFGDKSVELLFDLWPALTECHAEFESVHDAELMVVLLSKIGLASFQLNLKVVISPTS